MREELMKAKGAMLTKKRRITELETEIDGLASIIRSALAPWDGLDSMNIPLACSSSKRLEACHTERQALKGDYKRLEDEWGEL